MQATSPTYKGRRQRIQVDGKMYKLADAAKKMYIMRGVSGSGKSTRAKQLQGSGAIFSTDDFFMEGEEYKFDPVKIVEAHKWNQRRVWDAARKGIDPIVVDNTTTQGWEAKPYVVIAMTEGYDIDIVEPDSPWWSHFGPNMSEEELQSLAETLVSKTVHGVPVEGILNMLKRWEFDLDPMKILRSERPVWKPKKTATVVSNIPKYIKVKGFLYSLASVPFSRLTDDTYGKSIQALYQDLIGMNSLNRVNLPNIQVFVQRTGRSASNEFIYKSYKKREGSLDHWAVAHSYTKESIRERTVDNIRDNLRSIDAVYTSVEGRPVAYLGVLDLTDMPGGVSPAIAVHTVPTDSSGRLSRFPLQETRSKHDKKRTFTHFPGAPPAEREINKMWLPTTPSGGGGKRIKPASYQTAKNSDKNTAVYRADKSVATVAIGNAKTASIKKESLPMAKKIKNPPKMIRVGGVLYKLAALDVALQSEMQVLHSSLKKLSDEPDLDEGAKSALKRDALDSLGELGGIIKSM